MKEKIKTIELYDLNDETLFKIINFSAYDCDKVIIKCNMDITQEQINDKVIYLSDIQHELYNLLYGKMDVLYDKEKHDNIWTNVEADETNTIESITYTTDIIHRAIALLESCDDVYRLIDSLCDFVQDTFDRVFVFRNKFEGAGKRYFNYDFILRAIELSNNEVIQDNTYSVQTK